MSKTYICRKIGFLIAFFLYHPPLMAEDYAYKYAPELPFKYAIKNSKFEQALPNMKQAALGKNIYYYAYDEKGNEFRIKIDFVELPFWIYASYEFKFNNIKCNYILVDGFAPKKNDGEKGPSLNEPIKLEDGENAAIIRNCGSGFERISQEDYEGIFDVEAFRVPYNNPKSKEILSNEVKVGLAHNYVQNLIKAFNGIENLKKEFKKNISPRFKFNVIPYLIQIELKKIGIVDDSNRP